MKDTVEISHTNATNVTLCLLLFEDTFEKRKLLFFAQASRVKRKILNTFLQFREEKESIEEEEENYLTLRAE